MLRIIEKKKGELEAICRKYGLRRLELFGSAARGDEFDPKASDLDFIVEFSQEKNRDFLDDYLGLLDDLTNLFGRHVDLIENMEFSNPYFRNSVNETRTLLYGSPNP